jgi:hypothetical protein
MNAIVAIATDMPRSRRAGWPPPEDTQEEAAEQAAVRERRDAERDDDDRRLRVLREEQGAERQHDAPASANSRPS